LCSLAVLDEDKVNLDLICDLLLHIVNSDDTDCGAVLVFLPGLMEITVGAAMAWLLEQRTPRLELIVLSVAHWVLHGVCFVTAS
jgi:hypothetical protein